MVKNKKDKKEHKGFGETFRPTDETVVKFLKDVSENFGGNNIISARKGDIKTMPSAYASYFVNKGKAEIN